MSEIFFCPRAAENGGGPDSPFKPPFNGEATWREDETCSYCGSLNPDTLMRRLRAGDVILGTTDKNYKIYVINDGGEPFKQSHRDCPKEEGKPWPGHGPDECEHWVTREVGQTKFYFQHLSGEQQQEFVDLLNAKRLKFEGGIGFNRLPFFIAPA